MTSLWCKPFWPLVVCLCFHFFGIDTAWSATRDVSLPSSVFSLLKKWELPSDALSVSVHRVDTGETVVDFNGRIPRNPASTVKIITTAAALDLLGPQYVWQSRFYLSGTLQHGKLNGDLIFRGGGDPYFLAEKLWLALSEIRQKGLREFNQLVIDSSLFIPVDRNRASFDGKPYRVYNAKYDSALINFWSTRFSFYPSDSRVNIVAIPFLENLNIDNRLKVVSGSCSQHAEMQIEFVPQNGATRAIFSGSYPKRCGVKTIRRSLVAHADYSYGVFQKIWKDLGGRILYGYREGIVPQDAKLYLTVDSQPLSDIIRLVNKYSNNVMADNIFMTLGSLSKDNLSNTQRSFLIVSQWLRRASIHAPEFFMDNGSGLSRDARISAENLTLLLRYMYLSKYAPEFVASLSINGVDGTMRKRLTQPNIQGNLRIKTGSINEVDNVAGYVTASSGRQYAVTIFLNDRRVTNYRGNKIQDTILLWLYKTL